MRKVYGFCVDSCEIDPSLLLGSSIVGIDYERGMAWGDVVRLATFYLRAKLGTFILTHRMQEISVGSDQVPVVGEKA